MQGHLRKRGDSWYYSFKGAKINGKRKRFEAYGGKTRVQAEAALRKALDEYENGSTPLKLSNISVADYFDYWHKNFVVKTLKYNTQANYRNIIDKYIKPSCCKQSAHRPSKTYNKHHYLSTSQRF
nr:hypothetical protein [Lactiplantibacillus daowaiensis]